MNTIKSFLFWMAFVLPFCFCGCTNSDNSDDQDKVPVLKEKRLMQIVKDDGEYVNTAVLDYDKQGRIETVIDKYKSYNNDDFNETDVYTYTWTNDKVVQTHGYDVVELRVVDGLARTGTCRYGNGGSTNVSLLYDSKSRLLSYNFGYDYLGEISWGKEGVLKASTLRGEVIYSGKTCSGYNPWMVYNVSSTPWDVFAVAQPKLFGLNDNHLPDKIKGSGDDGVSFSYKFDKEGYLVEIIATYHGNYDKDLKDGESDIWKFTWE